MTEIFNSSVQYNDWEGTVAADNDHEKAIHQLLEKRGLITHNEILIGVKVWIGEQKYGYISIEAYLAEVAGAENIQAVLNVVGTAPKVRKVAIDNLSIEQFVGLFKRFSVALSGKNINLIGRELDTGE